MRIFSAPRVWSVLLSACVGVLLGLAGYTFYHAQGASYLSNDPAACVNCHIMREGAIKVSNHHVRSPLLNVAAACQTCHSFPEEEIRARAEAIQDRTRALMDRSEEAVAALIGDLEQALAAGASPEQLAIAQEE